MFLNIIFRISLIITILVGPTFAQEEASPTVSAVKVTLDEDEIVALVKEKYKGSPMETFMESNPRLTLLMVRAVKDESIVNLWKNSWIDKTKFYFFGGFFILTILLNWAWRRRQAQTLAPFHHKILPWLIRFSLINGSRIGVFAILFSDEISPVWDLFRKTFEV